MQRLLSSYSREIVKKFIEAVSPFKVVNEILQRYTSPFEYWSSSQDVFRAMRYSAVLQKSFLYNSKRECLYFRLGLFWGRAISHHS